SSQVLDIFDIQLRCGRIDFERTRVAERPSIQTQIHIEGDSPTIICRRNVTISQCKLRWSRFYRGSYGTPFCPFGLEGHRGKLARNLRIRCRPPYRPSEVRGTAKTDRLSHRSKRVCDSFDFAEIIRLNLYLQACGLAHGSVQIDCCLRRSNITLRERNRLCRSRIIRVNTPFLSEEGRLRRRR